MVSASHTLSSNRGELPSDDGGSVVSGSSGSRVGAAVGMATVGCNGCVCIGCILVAAGNQQQSHDAIEPSMLLHDWKYIPFGANSDCLGQSLIMLSAETASTINAMENKDGIPKLLRWSYQTWTIALLSYFVFGVLLERQIAGLSNAQQRVLLALTIVVPTAIGSVFAGLSLFRPNRRLHTRHSQLRSQRACRTLLHPHIAFRRLADGDALERQ